MMEMLSQRIADPRIVRLIRKWLGAGVVEIGEWPETDAGRPQGAVITPFAQKITLDFERIVRYRMKIGCRLTPVLYS
jgi:hypothetical protein